MSGQGCRRWSLRLLAGLFAAGIVAGSAQAEQPTYARIISVAVLEHMTSLPLELARSGLLLKSEGLFQAGIPSEGGFLWWLGWRCTTGISYWVRNHLDYGVVMRHEHVNTESEILALIHHLFGYVKVTRFPLPHEHLSLFAYIEARMPNRAECERFLHFPHLS